MENYYNLDGIKTALAKEIDRKKTLLNAWEKVTFATKKDGRPFQAMQKNIIGAKYNKQNYAMQDGENELTVYAHSEKCGYIHESINCYVLVKYLQDEERKKKTQNYGHKETFLEQVYIYDLDDIKKAISQRIDQLRASIESLEKQGEILPDVFNKFKDEYQKVMQTLAEETSEANDPTYNNSNFIYYAIRETVIQRYKYL